MSRFLASIAFVIASLSLAATASADKRVALVIGNSAYVNSTPLANPVNDAADMAAALTEVGFTVVHGLDVDKRGFDVRDARAGVSSHNAQAATRLLKELDHDLPAISEANDVACNLGHSGRDHGQVRTRKAQARSQLASTLPGEDDVGVGMNTDAYLVIAVPAPLE